MWTALVIVNPVFEEDRDKLRLIADSAKFLLSNALGYQWDFIKQNTKRGQLETETMVMRHALRAAKFNLAHWEIKEE